MSIPVKLVDTTFSSKDIRTAVSVYEYVATATVTLRVQVRLASVAGNGDYIAHLTLNDGDAQSDDAIGPRTTYAAASGETNFWFATMNLDVDAGDSVNVFIKGLSADSSRGGTIRIFTDGALQPTVAGRTLDVTATGAAGVDWSNIENPTSVVSFTNTNFPVIWDEVLTGATHNVPGSAGRRLRQLASSIIIDGTVVSATTNSITLDAGASAVNGAYDPALIYIVDGKGSGQSRLIYQYIGATRTATVDRDWKIIPDGTSEYVIAGDAGREHVNEGCPQGATINTITLNANASSFDDDYNGQVVFIRSGTGSDQVRIITDYTGLTKTAIVDTNWDVIPDTSSGYVMLPMLFGAITLTSDEITSISTGVLNSAVPGSYNQGTAGYALGRINTGIVKVSSIVTSTGDVTTYQGDNYALADGRAIEWIDSSGAWPDLAGKTIKVLLCGAVEFTGTVVTPSGANKKIRLELTQTNTRSIPIGEFQFVVRAELGTTRWTLVDALWTSHKEITVGG